MLKKLSRLLLIFVLPAMLFSGSSAQADTNTPGYAVFLPVLYAVGHTYLPMIINVPEPEWVHLNNGKIVCLVYDPNSPDIVYAGTWGGGVFKSVDGGNNWTPMNNGLHNLYINAMAIDPNNSDILYAGPYQDKLYKSINGGLSWAYAGNATIQDQAIVYAITVDPTNSNLVYIGTRGIPGPTGWNPWSGIVYKSTDGGASWTPSLTDVGGSNQQDWAYSLAVDPVSPNVVYAATHEHGPYRSDDYGATWRPVTTGLSDLSGRFIAIDPVNHNTLYFGVWHRTAIFKSTNGGSSWIDANSGIDGAKIFWIAIDPLNTSTIYAASPKADSADHWGIVKTINAGGSWKTIEFQNDNMYRVAVDPFNDNNVLAGSAYTGIWLSNNAGGSWHHSQAAFSNASVTSYLVLPGNGNTAFVSTLGGGVSESTDGGQTWTLLNDNLSDLNVHQIVLNPQGTLLFALTDAGGLYQYDLSSHVGWTALDAGLPAVSANAQSVEPSFPLPNPNFPREPWPDLQAPAAASGSAPANTPLYSLRFDPNNKSVAYLATGAGVYKSADGGSTWSEIYSGSVAYDVAVAPTNSNILYAATSDGVVGSADAGAGWATLGGLPDGVSAYSLSFSTVDHKLYVGTGDGVYKLGDNGLVPTGLTGVAVQAVAAHPTQSNLVYAATLNGAYLSADGGESWSTTPAELSGLNVQSIYVDAAHHQAYFGTDVHGALRVQTP